MKKRTLIFSLTAFLVTLSLLLASACASGGGETTKPGKLTGPQEITLNLGGEVNTIDPNRASWSNERSVIMQVFDGLLAFDANLNVVPMVAKEIPTVANKGISADGMTYTLKLRTDVTWSDGTKVTAKDFVFSIKRLFDPDLAAEYSSFYCGTEKNPLGIAGALAYFNSADKTPAQKAALRDAIAVRAVNDSTLEIKLIAPLPTFTQLLALWPVYPIREDMVAKYGEKWAQPLSDGTMPGYIGNGPFILKEWVQGDHYTFVNNPKYWGDKPNLTKITFREIEDAKVAYAAYMNNELDQSGVPGGTEKATMNDPNLSPQIQRKATLVTFGLQFNMTQAPFGNNLKLRQAISCAIDRQAYVDRVRGGVGRPALSWIPPGMPGFDEKLGAEYALNPTKAKQLLAEAGYPEGKGLPPLKLQYSQSGTNPVMAAFVQEQLKKNLGVDLILEPYASKELSALVNAKKFTWAWYGWGADYPDPDNWLPQLWGTGAGNNRNGYSNPAFDTLSAQGMKELDNTKRLKIWADAQKIIVDDAAIVFFMNSETFVLRKPWVKNMVLTGMDGQIAGDMFLRDAYIQK